MRSSRRAVLAGAAALLAGCSSTSPSDDDTTATTTTRSTTRTTTSTTTTRTTTTADPSSVSIRPEDAVRWERSFDAPIRLGPTVRGDTLYVGTAAGRLYAVAPDGRDRWTADIGGSFFDGVGYDGSPVVVNDTVYLTTGSQAGVLGEGYTLLALSATDGSVRWHRSPEPQFFLNLLGVADGRVYAATANDNIQPTGQTLFAYDTTGTRRWTAEVGDPMAAAVTDDAVAIASFTGLQLVGADGTVRIDDRDLTAEHPTFLDGRLLIVTPATDAGPGGVRAFDAATGTEQWSLQRSVDSLIVGNRAYAGGSLLSAHQPDGTEIWTVDRAARVTHLEDDTLYATTVADTGGATVIVLSATDGSERWRSGIDGEAGVTTAVDDDLAVLDVRGRAVIEVVDAATGDPRVHVEGSRPDDPRTLADPTLFDGRAIIAAEDHLYAVAA